jgi:hypothetical protein
MEKKLVFYRKRLLIELVFWSNENYYKRDIFCEVSMFLKVNRNGDKKVSVFFKFPVIFFFIFGVTKAMFSFLNYPKIALLN